MRLHKRFLQFAIGIIAVMLTGQLLWGDVTTATAQSSTAEPTCLASQPHATAGGRERLVHRYEGVSTDYWLYYTYGATDTAQQYAMELIITTSADSCEVVIWNAPGHTFAYSDKVPMEVAKQFSLAGFQQHLESVGAQAFEAYYATADPSLFFEEDLWALRQLGINLQ